MEHFLKALDYGVLGLCAIMIIVAWRIIRQEQQRKGYPRKGILRFASGFMIFCFLLACLNAWVQIKEKSISPMQSEEINRYKIKLADYKKSIENIDNLIDAKFYAEVKDPTSQPSKARLENTITRLKRAIENAKKINSD